MKTPKKKFLETKWLCYSTLAVITLVILSVWLSGTNSHRSLFQNSILSTSILGTTFFVFISSGLYFGLKLKENVGQILHRERIKKYSDHISLPDVSGFDPPAVGDSIGGVILSIILWFFVSIVFAFLLYFLGFFFWAAILFFAAMLYWIFFRALRLVFKNSKSCKDNLLRSLGFGLFYSFLYISWIYGIIFLVNYLN
ncbi:hypothetical protein [Chryseobacterium chendengshani]|uniref:hypothetical protein n=1 Tax=unclassified Chryseobacterium TaxID=2593645 RepID=UPI001C644CE6|nr:MULTISPECIES: hypothetical protein [unclassified Chryseobacterium]MBW7674595.1 hypothetical protein [Chryseobacterium sp. LJ756]MBW8522613.1 hypothetical protein [Chryseobacterium sp. LJ668]QYK16150.1 hypothetical protein K0U91_13975 [Chryseobacterium sp. LJ668]